jgi:hypothetical protein
MGGQGIFKKSAGKSESVFYKIKHGKSGYLLLRMINSIPQTSDASMVIARATRKLDSGVLSIPRTRSRKRIEAITAPMLITKDKATRVRKDISGNLGYNANEIAHPGINNKKRNPKNALTNPSKSPTMSIIR